MTGPTVQEFTGFSPDTCRFYQELRENNNKKWFDQNRERYEEQVREPLRSLMREVGQALKPVFDPFLTPDALEIAPEAGKVLARPNRRRIKDGELYYLQYWGAFYRERLTKQTDAQLSVNIQGDGLRTGFHVGELAGDQHTRFRESVLRNSKRVYDLLGEVGVREEYPVERLGQNWEPVKIWIKEPTDVYR